ncbi:MAG: S8 family serine peptidase [Actinomycetales bacterium]|nr:S8 family serine peptidase [Actinomycetales bacterium]
MTLAAAVIALVPAPVAGAAALSGGAPPTARDGGAWQRVIVTGEPGRLADVLRGIRGAGGRIERVLPVVAGASASLPADRLPAVLAAPGVRGAGPDLPGRLSARDASLGYDVTGDDGSLYAIAKITSATEAWRNGYTGAGVDVALVDSGVAPVRGLTSGNVINGPDLSVESVNEDLRYLDSFGHGTHLASIIAGRDEKSRPKTYARSDSHLFTGIAPDARLVSVKVAAADGSCDVSQVIAAIDWVVQHARDDGLDIRVLNLAYGTDSTQAAGIDPLVYAVENAWLAGITVVVSSGNDGTQRAELAHPAISPLVVAVGADDPAGTAGIGDDVVPAFAQRGTAARHVDVIAPGVHVLGLRVPNSAIDQAAPGARVGDRFFRGSGTSQAAAVVSGLAAIYLSRYPTATPDQVKAALTGNAQVPSSVRRLFTGFGVPDIQKAVSRRLPAATQQATGATGQGSLDLARGGLHLDDGREVLTGERDIFGRPWDGAVWAPASASRTAWSGGTWNGSTWIGTGWADASWTTSWVAHAWAGDSWSAHAWGAHSWTAHAWAGQAWSAHSWTDSRWGDASWNGSAWGSYAWS